MKVSTLRTHKFYYEINIIPSLSEDNQAKVIKAFNSTSWYLNGLQNFDNYFFDRLDNQIYPSELQLNNTSVSNSKASF